MELLSILQTKIYQLSEVNGSSFNLLQSGVYHNT